MKPGMRNILNEINDTKISHNTRILSLKLKYHRSRHKQIRSGSNKEIAEEKKSVAGGRQLFFYFYFYCIFIIKI